VSINNPVLFLGEQSLGTTAGAPLSTDANNQLSSGIQNNLATATSVTTASTTDVTMTGITVTPGAGTYLVNYSGTDRSSVAGATHTYGIFNNGTVVASTQRTTIPWSSAGLSTTQDCVVATHTITTVAAAQAIDVRWHTSAGTATAVQPTLTVVRLA